MESLPLRIITILLMGLAVVCAHPKVASAYEGFGANTGGDGGEIYTVTSLGDSGAGTLRNGILQRNFNGGNLVPRKIVFSVSGDIALNSTLEINSGYLTIDGSNAPEPGITLRKTNPNIKTYLHNVHDVIMSHIRFIGKGTTQGADNLSLQGAQRIVIDHVTSIDADHTGISLTGGDFDITVSWSLIDNCTTGMSVNNGPNGRISIHHNVLADGTGSMDLRYENQTVDIVNNVFAHWSVSNGLDVHKIEANAGYGNGSSDVNIINNAFAYHGMTWTGLVYGEQAGIADDGGPSVSNYMQGYLWTSAQGSLMGQVYVSGNGLHPFNIDHYSTISQPLQIPAAAQVTTRTCAELPGTILPYVGMRYRSTMERDLLNSIFPEMGGRAQFDIDLDGYIDRNDVDFMRDCRTGPSVPQTDPGCAAADLDHDGDVDQSDFGILQTFINNQDFLAMMAQPLLIDQGGNTMLVVSQNTFGTLQLTASGGDVIGTNLNWQIQPSPQVGSANIVSGSPGVTGTPVTLNYQPPTNYTGNDLFSVQVNDGTGASASILVNVIVTVPEPPPPPPGTPRTYYVGLFGNDSNTGSETQPFRTLLKAANTVQAGDTVLIHGGTYTTTGYPSPDSEATTTLLMTTDGTETAPIRFTAFAGESVTIDGRGLNSNAVSIESNYVIVSGMAFINCRRSGARIYASWETSGAPQPTTGPPVFTGTSSGRKVIGSQIIECIAHNNSTLSTGFFAGIQVRGRCENCIVENCVSFSNGRGILFEEESSVNTFRDWPLYKAGWPDAPVNCTLRGCIVYSNLKNDESSDGIQGRYMTGCTFKDCISYGNVDDNFDAVASSDCIFEGNVAFNANPNAAVDGDGNGMKLDTRRGGGNIVRNNITFLNPRAGFDNDDGTSDFYHNNIAYRNGINNALGYGFLIESDVAANKLMNNISYLNTTGDGTLSQDCPNAPPFGPNPTNFNYWGDANPPYNPCNGQKYGDTHSYAFGTNSKGLSVVGNPLFANPPTSVSQIDISAVSTIQPGGIQSLNSALLSQIRGKFSLQVGSPCINAGTNAAAFYETPGTMPFNGSAPDLGAVESP